MSELRLLVFATIMATLMPIHAHAGVPEEWKTCIEGGGVQQQEALPLVIAACSARIASGAETPARLTRAYVARAAAYFSLNDAAHGRADFATALALLPNDERLQYLVGQNERLQGNYNLALTRLNQAVKLKPAFIEALLERGLTYILLKEYKRGWVDLDHAEVLQPGNWMVNQYLGYARLEQGDCEKALPHFARALQLEPDNAEAFYLIGLCKAKGGMLEEAKLNLEQAAAVSPEKRIYAVLGRVHADLGEFSKAVQDYSEGLKLDASDVSLLNDRCWARAEWGQELTEALADCNRAISTLPSQPNLLDSRAFVRYRLGDYAAAILDLDAALQLQPNAAPSLYVRGLARLKLGDIARGEADLAAATAAKPSVISDYRRFGIEP